MELRSVKIVSGAALFILSLCFGLIVPFLIWRSRSPGYRRINNAYVQDTDSLISEEGDDERGCCSKKPTRKEPPERPFKKCWLRFKSFDAISAINCICGGIFLGICLLELLPQSRKNVENIMKQNDIETTFPATEFIVVAGFLLVMFVENIVVDLCGSYETKQVVTTVYPSCSHHDNKLVVDQQNKAYGACKDDVTLDVGESGEEMTIPPKSASVTSQSSSAVIRSPSEVSEERRPSIVQSPETTRAFVFIGMLTLHSVFEGLALGFEESVSPLIQLLLAICVHKSVLSFGIGIRMFDTFSRSHARYAIICIVMFCAASPLGCFIGTFMTPPQASPSSPKPPASEQFPSSMVALPEDLDTKLLEGNQSMQIASALLQCLATGTFLYVTFVEVIPEEFSHAAHDSSSGKHKIQLRKSCKLILLLFGFGLICGLQFI